MTQTFYGCASITDSKRTQILNQEWSRGPGSYKPRLEDTQRIPKWTLKPKIQHGGCFAESHQNKNPGPSDYNINKKQQEQYDSLIVQKNKANKNNLMSQALKLEKEKELQRKEKEEASKAYEKMLRKHNEQNLNSEKNKENVNIDKGMSKTFGYRDENGHVFSVVEKSPGPVYNVSQDILRKTGGRWGSNYNATKVQRKSFQEKVTSFPGPGAYNNEKSKGQGWTIGKSKRVQLKKSCTSENLGPDAYNPQILKNIKNCTLKGKNSSLNLVDTNSPAPGSYEIADTKSKKGTIFSHSVRVKDHKALADSPSPFSYEPMNSTLKNNGFSLGKKLEVIQNRVQNPGPGTYETVEEQNLACLKSRNGYNKSIGGYMGRKNNEKKKLYRSQDNFYKYNPNYDYVNHEYPKFSFRQADYIPKNMENQDNLGPGSYNNSESSFYANKNSKGELYSFPKNPRFTPLSKESAPVLSKLASKQNSSDCFGYMPSYLIKPKKKVQNQSKILAQSHIIKNTKTEQ